MSLEHNRLVLAEQSVRLLGKLRSELNDTMLAFASAVRTNTCTQVEPDIYDALTDGLRRVHPDNDYLKEIFDEVFEKAMSLANKRVDEARDELSLERRKAGYLVAAE